MAYKVFVDTNVLIDILVKRPSFFENSQKAVADIVKRKFIPFISGSSITDFYYICKKSGVEKEAIFIYLKDLLKAFEVLIIDKDSIYDAIFSSLKDFEDAVQIMACRREEINLILTRDKKDFKNEWIEVQTPEEYLVSILHDKPGDSIT